MIYISINSKEKGKRHEREVANILRKNGYDARRTAQYCGKTEESSDVTGVPGFHIECKHYKKTGFKYEWLKQAKEDAAKGNIPVVVHRIDGKPNLVTMELTDFLYLASRYK